MVCCSECEIGFTEVDCIKEGCDGIIMGSWLERNPRKNKLTPEQVQSARRDNQRARKNKTRNVILMWIVLGAIVSGLWVGVRSCGRAIYPENFQDGQNLLKEKYTQDGAD